MPKLTAATCGNVGSGGRGRGGGRGSDRDGGGRGRGCGHVSGRGSGCGDEARSRQSGNQSNAEVGHEPVDGQTHNQDQQDSNEDAQFLVDNLDGPGMYMVCDRTDLDYDTHKRDTDTDTTCAEVVALASGHGDTSNTRRLLLLDSCSTVNLVSNDDMLHNVHAVPIGMRVRCNAGIVVLTKMGYLGNYPEPDWHTVS